MNKLKVMNNKIFKFNIRLPKIKLIGIKAKKKFTKKYLFNK
mgnify:CR=1 FL=1